MLKMNVVRQSLIVAMAFLFPGVLANTVYWVPVRFHLPMDQGNPAIQKAHHKYKHPIARSMEDPPCVTYWDYYHDSLLLSSGHCKSFEDQVPVDPSSCSDFRNG